MWYIHNLHSHDLLSWWISDQCFIVIACLRVSKWVVYTHLTSSLIPPRKKKRFIYDQNLYNQRVKVTRLRSRIYTYLKSHLISKDAQKNCCFECFRKLPERRLYWCFLKYLELSNLHQGYFLLPPILKMTPSQLLFASFSRISKVPGRAPWENHVLLKKQEKILF